MTLKQFKDKVSVTWKGYGTYRIEIEYRGREYTCLTHNAPAYDRIKGNDDWTDRTVACFYTLKQAYQHLWDECKRKNDIF